MFLSCCTICEKKKNLWYDLKKKTVHKIINMCVFVCICRLSTIPLMQAWLWVDQAPQDSSVWRSITTTLSLYPVHTVYMWTCKLQARASKNVFHFLWHTHTATAGLSVQYLSPRSTGLSWTLSVQTHFVFLIPIKPWNTHISCKYSLLFQPWLL